LACFPKPLPIATFLLCAGDRRGEIGAQEQERVLAISSALT
jgi:hypothetical protein